MPDRCARGIDGGNTEDGNERGFRSCATLKQISPRHRVALDQAEDLNGALPRRQSFDSLLHFFGPQMKGGTSVSRLNQAFPSFDPFGHWTRSPTLHRSYIGELPRVGCIG